MEQLKENIYNILNNNLINIIIFEKKDGSIRALNGTRCLDNIPLEKQPKDSKQIAKGNSIPVFDIDKNEWRSFSLNLLHSINGEDYTKAIKDLMNKSA